MSQLDTTDVWGETPPTPQLKIQNTLGRSKALFNPLIPGKASLYVCGVTTYDLCHIGHGRASVVFDVVARQLRYLGYEVKHVRNYTDVDDKIIRRAQSEGVEPLELAGRYVQAAQEDMLALGCLPPDVEPKVSTHMAEIIAFIEGLVKAGKAYPAANGDVYYSVKTFDGYGKLSGKKVEDLIAGARCDVIDEKELPCDFALWKAAKPGEPFWESPWGQGRPGWHIECSAMCGAHLGEQLDIHGGGSDLIFPHHENEIAQSEGLYGKQMAQFWVHNAMITLNNEKMSKSIGNILPIRSALERYHREALRLFYLGSHHRSPIDYSPTSLAEAEVALERLYMSVDVAEELIEKEKGGDPETYWDDLYALIEGGVTRQRSSQMIRECLKRVPAKGHSKAEAELSKVVKGALHRFDEAMNDDFNSAMALGVIFEIARALRSYRVAHRKVSTTGAALAQAALVVLKGILPARLGLLTETGEDFRRDLNIRRLQDKNINPEEIDALVQARVQARSDKDWAEADRVRDVLLSHGVLLEDGPKGTIWRVQALSEV